MTGAEPKVSVIVLNYNAPIEMLDKCLTSLAGQTYRNIEIILADNGSSNDSVARVRGKYTDLIILEFGQNYGFAAGNNRAIQAASGEYILLLNNDAYPRPDAIERMVEVLNAGGADVIGTAPKMMLAQNEHVFDSIGNLIDDRGCAFNMGIGQLDIGQYDKSEDVFGVCFGAGLLRRAAFDASAVGPMDVSYFMYYEDVDWCWRANVMGYRFLTAPQAVVIHEHSASTKEFAYRRKYYLIERNLMKTCARNFRLAKAIRIIVRRVISYVRNSITGPYRATSLRLALSSFFYVTQVLLFRRRRVQAARKVADERITSLSFGEAPHFDPENYAPAYNLATLIAMYRRRYAVTGTDRDMAIVRGLEELSQAKIRFDVAGLRARLRDTLAGESDAIMDFIAKVRER